MRTLEVFDLEPASFFAAALDTVADPEHYLSEVAGEGRPRRDLRRLTLAARRLAREGGTDRGEKPGPTVPAAALVEAMARRPRAAQQRSLRAARRYRHAAFAAGYLDHLDDLRFQRPREAAALAATVAGQLVPRLPAARPQRIALACRALGVFASAERGRGETARAAGALRLALDLARRHGLPEVTAELLQRGSYVLSDRGRFRQALAVLREALEIYFDRELGFGVAKTLVDRGIVYRYAGRDRDAVRALTRALDFLPAHGAARGAGLDRNREALYHHLIQAATALGDHAEAERYFAAASRLLNGRGAVRARLAWQHGRILLARGEPRAAELRLRRACDIFDRERDPERALAALDLALALLAQGRPREARLVAREQLALLMFYRGRGLAERSLRAFERALLVGELEPHVLERLAGELQKSRARPAHSRPTSRRGDQPHAR